MQQTIAPYSKIERTKTQKSVFNINLSLKSEAILIIKPRTLNALQYIISMWGLGSNEVLNLNPRSKTVS